MPLARTLLMAAGLSLLFCTLSFGADVASSCDSSPVASSNCLQDDDYNSLLQVKASVDTPRTMADSLSRRAAWAGFDYWEKAYCLANGAHRGNCAELLRSTRDYCEKQKETKTYRRVGFAFNVRCKDFASAPLVKEITGDHAIADAVKKCEPAALSVCKESTCPAYCAMTEKKDCDCEEMCDAASANSFAHREVNCQTEDGQTIDRCLEKHYEKLTKNGQTPELQALLREHIVKCVCVNRQEDTTNCYSGSQGIAHGKTWCEFDRTPSWQRLVRNAATKPAGPKPDCTGTAGNVQG